MIMLNIKERKKFVVNGGCKMRATHIIELKKRGIELTEQQISFIVNGYVKGEVPDYQMSAFLMAVCLKGMSSAETAFLTNAMLLSGDTVDLSSFGALSADKHSTGGVGDKTTLIVAPIVSSLGCIVAKMSGRGLGHTGGTIDKLESIDGFCTDLSHEEFLSQIKRIGIAVIGQTGNLVPADKMIYALRDATATVDSISLIASSIMSKKLAGGAKNIVLDVKYGAGAFMKTKTQAEKLAKEMISIGEAFNRNVSTLITNADAPLGYAVGNSLEVIEAVQVLKGEMRGEIRDLCVDLASNMLMLSLGWDEEYAVQRANEEIDSGRAFSQMKKWVAAQGGNEEMLENTDLFIKAPYIYEVKSEKEGYIEQINAEKIGLASCMLGAGRTKKEDNIDMFAGILFKIKVSDYVKEGCTLATLHTSNKALIKHAEKLFYEALSFSPSPAESSKNA